MTRPARRGVDPGLARLVVVVLVHRGLGLGLVPLVVVVVGLGWVLGWWVCLGWGWCALRGGERELPSGALAAA